MADNRRHKRKTLLRKRKQAEKRYLVALRIEAVNFEHITEKTSAKMSREALERTIKNGKRRRGITGAPMGIPLAVAAAQFVVLSKNSGRT